MIIMETYQFDYYDESLSMAFESADAFDAYNNLTLKQRETIVSGLLGSIECQSMAFGYVDTRGESYEEKSLKGRIKELEKEAQDWQNAFIKNVSSRRGWDKNEIKITKDGEAYL